MTAPLLELHDLSKHYSIRTGLLAKRLLYAVDRVNLSIPPGQTLGLVGESGCGKTTLARCILRIVEPSSGEILFNGINILRLNAAELRACRREFAIIYQNPFLSLNPRLCVHDLIAEPIQAHLRMTRIALRSHVEELLLSVGLDSSFLSRRARDMSGGQAQRVAIARALALNPRLLILDEPSSALDVSVQAQVLNLLSRLQQDHGLGYLLISHNLGVIEHMADQVAVMYLGQIVEQGPADEFFARPCHPYTRALLASTPKLASHTTQGADGVLEGQVPNAMAPPSGCHFHPRCPIAQELCQTEPPALRLVGQQHTAACHYVEPIA